MKFHGNSSILSGSTCVMLGSQVIGKPIPASYIMESNGNTILTLVYACDLVCSD